MIKKILLISVLAATGLALAQASVQARPDISDIRSPRSIQEIVCERFSSRWIFPPTCQAPEPPAEPQCGNSVVESGEECDGSAPAGYICTNQCQLVIDIPEPQCGNNLVEAGEACDGSAPAGFVCTNQCDLQEVITEPEIVSYGYASLLGVGVVPPVDVAGHGTAVFWLDDENNMNYDLTVAALTGPITSAHFHGSASSTQNAGVLFDITNTFDGFHAEGVWEELTLDSLGYLLNDEIYLSLHTDNHPDGELRGQVYLDDVGIALLRAESEVPPVFESAVGTGFFKWQEETDDLWFRMTASNLTGPVTAANFHGQASEGENADVIFDISFFIDGQHIEGNWTGVNQAKRNYLVNELVYVNLQTEAYPTGELRGQVIGLPSPAVDLEQLVINEVYADVDSEHGEEGSNEWIELYNNGATIVNLLDWIIEDSEESSDILQEEVMVAPGEFVLISQATSTFEVYWPGQIPAGTHLIALGSPIGSGLANSGDALLLKSGDGIMDAMSYGNDSSIFDLTAAGAGKSLSRDPNGKDTNTADDWIELDEPTPGF